MSETTLVDRESSVTTNPELYVIKLGDEKWARAEEVEASVFIEKGYVAKAEELSEEYEPYLPGTDFLAATIEGSVVGSVRCMRETPTSGFKTLSDINNSRLVVSESGRNRINAIDTAEILEIGTLAVAPEYRSRDDGRISVHLYGAIFGFMKANSLTTVIASFDERYFNSFKEIFGDTVEQLGPATEYMGSPTVPAVMNVYEMFAHLERTMPEVYETVREASENVQSLAN